MVACLNELEATEAHYDIRQRALPAPTRQPVALKIERSGRQRLANQARHGRSRKSSLAGPHRRKQKRFAA